VIGGDGHGGRNRIRCSGSQSDSMSGKEFVYIWLYFTSPKGLEIAPRPEIIAQPAVPHTPTAAAVVCFIEATTRCVCNVLTQTGSHILLSSWQTLLALRSKLRRSVKVLQYLPFALTLQLSFTSCCWILLQDSGISLNIASMWVALHVMETNFCRMIVALQLVGVTSGRLNEFSWHSSVTLSTPHMDQRG